MKREQVGDQTKEHKYNSQSKSIQDAQLFSTDETLIFGNFELVYIDQSRSAENSLDQKCANDKHQKSQEQNVIELTNVIIDP